MNARALVVGLLVGACSRAASPRPLDGRGGAPAETLAAMLIREVGAGAAVAIVPGAAGLRAVSADGARARVLVPGAVAWAVVDLRANVAWFGGADTTAIYAVDLEAPAVATPAVISVATGLPPGDDVAMVGPVIYGVVYPTLAAGAAMSAGEAWAGGEELATGAPGDLASAHVTLAVTAEPSLSGSSGYAADEAWEAEVAAAAIPGRAFVAGLRARPDRRPAAPAVPADTWLDGVDPSGCDDARDCGRAEPIAGTRFWRVMTGNVAGDVRHLTWRLYDTEARAFVAAEWATWFQDAVVAPDHSAFIADGVVVRFDTGPLAATPADDGGGGGGWLGGGTFYGF